MALLKLSDIGKIYVSEGNVSVGIRGVNLSFDKGEFVAITGKSGSGKSTLLNIIGGSDTYEEGELFLFGDSTSHYLEADREEYREKYISFIYQDYNIIESFTVLENVELALMHIEDKQKRRERAMELLERVGLGTHVHHKGSKLSGGQKQRTVIARALAKDSPIILADEPTGNLDSATSREIIQLLSEVAKEKLLIVVTHDFDEVSEYATRHIRIFDGAVEFDHSVRAAVSVATDDSQTEETHTAKDEIKRVMKGGFALGKAIFKAKPKLTAFICLLMIIGAIGVFAITSLCSGATDIFEKHKMFTHIDGRVVVAKQSGEAISSEDFDKLRSEFGAIDAMRFDLLLDSDGSISVQLPESDDYDMHIFDVVPTYGEDFGDDIIGRYPEQANEVLLYVPIYMKPVFGKKEIKTDTISLSGITAKVVGVKYYYDNNIKPRCLLTEEGFRVLTAYQYIARMSSFKASVNVYAVSFENNADYSVDYIIPSFDIEKGKVYFDNEKFNSIIYPGLSSVAISDYEFNFSAIYYSYNYYYGGTANNMVFEKTVGSESFTDKRPSDVLVDSYQSMYSNRMYVSSDLICEIAESVLDKSYKQASLFYEDDRAADAAIGALREAGYVAVRSDATYNTEAGAAILDVILAMILLFIWFITVVFLSFFISLCTSRAIEAFRSDIAIMRSMGIRADVIRAGMYVRMLLSLIPAFAMLLAVAISVFTVPALNEFFTYLYFYQYVIIVVGLILLTLRITHKQIHSLFGESVRRSLKGGASE